MPDLSDTLSQIGVPTLVIWGEGDKRATLSIGQMLCDSIRNSA